MRANGQRKQIAQRDYFAVRQNSDYCHHFFIGSALGGFFGINGSQIPILWPQAGIALASVLLLGYSFLPGIFLGAFITALAVGVTLPFALVNALGNTLSAFFAAHFILQQNSFSKKLNNYQSVFALVLFGVVIGPFISATVNIIGMYFLQISPIETLPALLGNKWMRNALGVLIFTPTMIVWLGNPLPKFETRKIIEGIVIFGAIFALGILLFLGEVPMDTVYPVSFLVFPLVIWASVRNEIHGSTLINFTSSLLFLWGVAHEHGSLFNNGGPHIMSYVSIIGTMLITSLIISTSMAKLSATQKSLSYLSTHDVLTGLYNRLFFETEFKRLENGRQYPISIIMADIDALKHVNDNFGHKTGDQVLMNVSSLFAETFRSDDIVSRYGGDEFVILLPYTNADIANKIVKRIKKQIVTYNRKHSDLPINISMGVSTANQGESLNEHLKRADERMYEEKQKNKRR